MIRGAAIVGGGVAGGALAIHLARAGREPVLFEREPAPTDKVCGEFLSPEACLYLRSLGVDLAALGAVPIGHLRLYERDRCASCPLPFAAMSVSRRVLDSALLELAAAAGAQIRRGAKVWTVSPSGAGQRLQLEANETYEARTLFLATGKHDLRSQRRPAGLQNDLVAFKLHWWLAPEQRCELAGHVELVLFEGGYLGLQAVENGRANLCLVLRRRQLQQWQQRWSDVLAGICASSPHLTRRLRGAETCEQKPLAISSIPYGYVGRAADGVWRLGDQAAVIPSFCGDGIAIALHSAELAAASYLAGEDASAYQRRLARDVTRQVLGASVLSQAVVRRPWQAAFVRAARVWPALVPKLALHTRVSEAALARAAQHRSCGDA